MTINGVDFYEKVTLLHTEIHRIAYTSHKITDRIWLMGKKLYLCILLCVCTRIGTYVYLIPM